MSEVSKQQPQVPVETVDQFGTLLLRWFGNTNQRLKHLLTLPVGTEFQIGEDKSFRLTGDAHRGFLLGVNLALMELDTLPFTSEPGPADAANDSVSQDVQEAPSQPHG